MTLAEEVVTSYSDRMKIDCRQRHLKIQSPNMSKAYCAYCESYTEKIALSKKCNCCNHIMKRPKNNTYLNSVINKGLKENEKQIEDFCIFPIPEKMMKKYGSQKTISFKDAHDIYRKADYPLITFRHVVYEIPIKWLVVANENWSDKALALQLICEKTAIKGLTIKKE
jgi:hypothetical protein